MQAYTQVTAPFDGVVTKRYANTGAMIQAGTASQTQAMPVVRVSQNNLLRLILPVPESIVPLVRVGQALTVQVPTLNRSFPGHVARFSDRVQQATRTMETEVDVPNPNFALIPGMFAEVNFTTDSRAHALTIPIAAVDLAAGSEKTGKVLTVGQDGLVESRDLSLGLQTADSFEVVSGLQEGDVVIVGNRANLRAGQRVRPKFSDVGKTGAQK
jgi:RND family efflux transporter MFP subunit